MEIPTIPLIISLVLLFITVVAIITSRPQIKRMSLLRAYLAQKIQLAADTAEFIADGDKSLSNRHAAAGLAFLDVYNQIGHGGDDTFPMDDYQVRLMEHVGKVR
jgi:hypothetical protein